MTAPLPVTVVGGYLGAGKTTLINQVLRQANGLRIAVLVNEFGALPIDEDLIEAQDGDVISIAGGCICCTFGDNLTGALVDMGKLDPRPDHILIEASGVAIPGSIALMLTLVQEVELAGMVVLADAETVRKRARDKYLGDTIERQLQGADIVAVTKTDLVDPAELAAITAWLHADYPNAQVVPVRDGHCSNAIILGDFPSAPIAGNALHERDYATLSFAQTGAADPEAIAQALAGGGFDILRAKGFVQHTSGATHIVQVVGTRGSASPWTELYDGGLVCIGLSGQIDRYAITQVLGDHGFAPRG